MTHRPPLDPLIKNVRLVRSFHAVETRDLAVADGRFARVEPVIDTARARAVSDRASCALERKVAAERPDDI